MNHIVTLHESDILSGKEDLNSDNFRIRAAARAITLNGKGEIALYSK